MALLLHMSLIPPSCMQDPDHASPPSLFLPILDMARQVQEADAAGGSDEGGGETAEVCAPSAGEVSGGRHSLRGFGTQGRGMEKFVCV